MLPWLHVLSLSLSLAVPANTASTLLGVNPKLLARYAPDAAQKWTCLDRSKQIPWTAVNDDYCDCPDGSDEPGSSACSTGVFWCANDGHIGASIHSSRVNDGLCEYECCDGSDEASGACPNICKEVGEAYRNKVEAERKLRKTGSKIRSTYVAYAQKEKKRLEGVISAAEKDISEKEKEVARLKDIADRTEAISAEELERKKSSPLYITLLSQSTALKSLRREHEAAVARSKALEDILDSLRSNYNPNYQDMAVLEAVRSYEYQANLPHIGSAEAEANEEGSDEEDEEAKEDTKSSEIPEGEWSAEELEHQLDTLVHTDYVSLLVEHEKHIGADTDDPVYDITAYLPDSLIPQYEVLRTFLSTWLPKLGIIKAVVPGGGAADANKAREAYNAAERNLDQTKKDLDTAKEDLSDLFDVKGFGPQGEWKKLEGTCLSKDTGEYTYEVCLFDEARQKANHGGSTFSLGQVSNYFVFLKFSSWNTSPDATPGSPEYYSRQVYTQGTKCWNGPHRSVTVYLSCGTENTLNTIVELEKCEYQFIGTTPALCLPLDEAESKPRDEL
ncbi:hypothetical protein FA95DRAFT_1483311 [Auriscalpium vulgare]|uniref:Uncharacterized protein n=1 Tax=Auriscalpium vulgare TaxID=40419 RepID=A0ACB8S8Y4_9AGAM|nr:hypothetical protein FA95DRAFT_1483311 [Auriscalpium vulgare]